MFTEKTKTLIQGYSDAALLEYVLIGTRQYDADAVAFARQELDRRKIPEAQLAVLRSPILEKLTAYDIHEQLIEGTDIADIARQVAPMAGVTPGQAWSLITAMRPQLTAAPGT
jgi:hypothetical protein